MNRKIISCLTILLVSIIVMPSLVEAVIISPTELTIRSIDKRRDYQFIVMLESQEKGLVDVELKASHDSVSSSPDKFMLNEGEQRSVRLHLNPKAVEDIEEVRVQPYVNSVPSEDMLTIQIQRDLGNESSVADEEERQSITDEPAFFTLIIYGLIFIIAILVILVFIPEIKKNVSTAKTKTKETSEKRFYRRSRSRLNNLGKRLDKSDKKIKKIIEDVEKFHERSHRWIVDNSGGKYGLE